MRPFVGHGIGQSMHEEPQVPNYGRPGTGMLIEAGMCFAIEPMFTLGGDEVVVADDNWTVRTADGSLVRPLREHDRGDRRRARSCSPAGQG